MFGQWTFHFIFFIKCFSCSEVDYVDTYKAMEKLVESGLVRSIGVSNFNSEQIDRLLANCTVKPVTNQIEVGPSITQKKLTKFCNDRDIVITGYSPLGRPYNAGLNPELPMLAFLDPRVISIGEKYGKTGAQVVLRYLVGWTLYRLLVSTDNN